MTAYFKASDLYLPGSRTLPGRYYTSADIYAQEQEKIFACTWLCAGRAEQITSPGDYFLFSVGDESLVVLRDPSGNAHAFYNVCRHRGTRLCTQEQGRLAHSIQCPYHSWTYALDGRLIGAPQMESVPGFDRREYPLHAAALVEWEGFVFVHLENDPQPFAQAFAPLLGKFAAWELGRLQVARRIEYTLRANWKLIAQNYSECYHCPSIHPDLVRLSPYRSGQNDLVEAPFLGGYMDLNAESMTLSGRVCAAPFANVSEPDRRRAYYYAIFPTLMLSLFPEYVMVHRLLPEGPQQTRVICEWLFTPEALASPSFDPVDAVEFWDRTNRQDWQVSELTQLGVASRVYSPSPYNAQEGLLAAFDRYYLGLMEDR